MNGCTVGLAGANKYLLQGFAVLNSIYQAFDCVVGLKNALEQSELVKKKPLLLEFVAKNNKRLP